MKFRSTVTITAASATHADTVLVERLGCDEDYGFDYSVEWTAAGPDSAAIECLRCGKSVLEVPADPADWFEGLMLWVDADGTWGCIPSDEGIHLHQPAPATPRENRP